MKKIISVLLSTALISTAQARETITLIYSWGFGDSIAGVNRALVKEANEIQDRYQFLFDARPGAGGSIAANYVAKTPNTVLITSSAFYIRPAVYPNESYDINKYQVLISQFDCPMAITSGKYKTWDQVPRDKRLTIGTSGMGVTTHLAATQIVTKYPQMQVVPFKATSESLVSTIAGDIDLHVAFLSEPESWTKDQNNTRHLNVLGITGRVSVKQYRPLTWQGFPAILADMDVPFQLIVPADMTAQRYKELRDILQQAMKSRSVQDLYAVDYCTGTEDRADMKKFMRNQRDLWYRLATAINLNR